MDEKAEIVPVHHDVDQLIREKRRGYTREEILSMAKTLRTAKYTSRPGPRTPGEHSLIDALISITGKSAATIRRYLAAEKIGHSLNKAKSSGGGFWQVRQEALKRARAIQVMLAMVDLPLDVKGDVSDTSLQRAIGRDCAEIQDILHSARSCLRIAEVRLRGIADLVELDTPLLPPKPHTTCAAT